MKTIVFFCAFGLILFQAQSATYTIKNTDDSGTSSLRWAIQKANGNPGTDIIQFDIPGSGWHTIKLLSSLPSITEGVFIDGYSQPGAHFQTGKKQIELSGLAIPSGYIFTIVQSGHGTTIQGFVMDGVENYGAILISNSTRNEIYGNYIGIDREGLKSANSLSRNGIRLEGTSADNIIGDTSYPGMRNVIAGIDSKIYVTCGIYSSASGSNNRVTGNYLGVDYQGKNAIPMRHGIYVQGGTRMRIGKNLVSGNDLAGSSGIRFEFTDFSEIEENTIGLDVDQKVAIPNGFGIHLISSPFNTLDANVISGNDAIGLSLVGASGNSTITRNYIGTDGAGEVPIGNSMGISISADAHQNLIGGAISKYRNVISGNASNGISCWSDDNEFYGNIIGLNQKGVLTSQSLGNGNTGMAIVGNNNRIGGSDVIGYGNIISSNGHIGLTLNQGAKGNYIQGNRIGMDRYQTPAGNGSDGIQLSQADGNRIGGDQEGEGNYIAHNGKGVVLWFNSDANQIWGNHVYDCPHVGVLIYGDCEDNSILSNVIYDNNSLGIDLLNAGGGGWFITPNDQFDPDLGGNNLQNFPVLSMVKVNGGFLSEITGDLHSESKSHFLIQVFLNPNAVPGAIDPSGHGEGYQLVSEFQVTTDGNGDAHFQRLFVPNSTPVDPGVYTATATKLTLSPQGQIKNIHGTSEFSAYLNPIAKKGGELQSRAANNSFNQSEMTVYPNPVADELNLVGWSDIEGPLGLAILNAQGQVIKTSFTELKRVSINVSELPKGYYFLKVNGQDRQELIRFVKH